MKNVKILVAGKAMIVAYNRNTAYKMYTKKLYLAFGLERKSKNCHDGKQPRF